MKARIASIALAITVGFFYGSAQEAPSPAELGAHFANLSDHAQIELLLDALRSSGGRNTLRARSSANETEAAAGRAEKTGAPGEIFIAGDQALVEWASGQQLELSKGRLGWRIVDGRPGELPEGISAPGEGSRDDPNVAGSDAVSAGQTFIPVPLSEEYRIDRLSRGVTRAVLDRALFGAPEKSAAYYTARYQNRPPYVRASYVQLVTDPAWNRILYGSLGHSLKAYEDVQGPAAISVDANGRVIVGETGRKRLQVLQLNTDTPETELFFLFEIPGVGHPGDLALDDRGTPLDTEDDQIWVADPVNGKISCYALASRGATKIGEFGGFETPGVIAVGRWNGASNGLLYVIDRVGRRLQAFEREGNGLRAVAEVQGDYGQYFNALETDHFGNLYVVDNANSQLFKYTAQLELLDKLEGWPHFEGLANLEIAFGKITVEGEGTFWAGFDQLFTLERWTDTSGARRHLLGVRIKDARFFADPEVSAVSSRFTLTDFADLEGVIVNEREEVVRKMDLGWVVSGPRQIAWDRLDDNGRPVVPGQYRWEIQARSPYREKRVTVSAQFYLPLFIRLDCGSGDVAEVAAAVQGVARHWGDSPSATVQEDPRRVVYRLRGLQPERDYQIKLECYAGDDQAREQRILVGGEPAELTRLEVENRPRQTSYLAVPKAGYAGGDLEVIIEKLSGPSAVVSQIWLKESGVDFQARPQSPDGEPLPIAFSLGNNYPNPFNPQTTIRFQLPRDSRVRLEIFNILGQKVRTLLDQHFAAGSHTAVWDGRRETGVAVASGIYFYRMTAGSFVATRRMLLLR